MARRKSRRATVVLSRCFIAGSSFSISLRLFIRQREGFHLDLHKQPSQRADAPVEIGMFGALEIGEETADPGRQVLFKYLPVRAFRRREAAAGHPRHDLAE